MRRPASAAPLNFEPPKIEQEKSRWEFLVQYFASPLIIGFIGFYFGSQLEQKKMMGEGEKQFREYRMKLWISTTTHFTTYVTNWSRLREISLATSGRTLSPDEAKRKEGYISGRTEARDALSADLEQVKVLFEAPDLATKIDEFRNFVSKYQVTPLEGLPPHEEWVRRKDAILGLMREELLRKK